MPRGFKSLHLRHKKSPVSSEKLGFSFLLITHKITVKFPGQCRGILFLRPKMPSRALMAYISIRQRYLPSRRKGLAVLHTGCHPQGPGPIGDHQPRNILYPIAGKARPQRRARPHHNISAFHSLRNAGRQRRHLGQHSKSSPGAGELLGESRITFCGRGRPCQERKQP